MSEFFQRLLLKLKSLTNRSSTMAPTVVSGHGIESSKNGSELAIEPKIKTQDSPTIPTTHTIIPGSKVNTDPLFVDIYAGDITYPNWALMDLYPNTYFGAIIKATEGTYYNGGGWFNSNWGLIKSSYRGSRQTPWFRGCYHYLKFNQSGKEQAEYYLDTVGKAGGFAPGDLPPIVDVELGGARDSNQSATASQIMAVTTQFAEAIRAKLGRPVILYGNGAMRDRSIKDRMGCDYLWCPRYTPTLPRNIYERAGWDSDRLLLWQYCGDGVGGLAGYPTASPLGRTDISVLTLPGGLTKLKEICA